MLKRLRRWAREALIILAIVIGVQLWQTRGLAEGMAPPLAGTDLAGQPAGLARALTAGKPVLVAFWATWCAVCRVEMGNLEAIARDTPLVAVAMQSGDGAEVAKVLKERGRSLPAIVDADGRIARAWNVRGVPTHYIIDRRGRVRFAVVGYATEWGLRARLWWAERLTD